MRAFSSIVVLAAGLSVASVAAVAAESPTPDQPPVGVVVAVAPAAPGAEASVTVTLTPRPGIKLNRYPKIKLVLPAAPGISAAAEGSIGNSAPPPADHLDANYYKGAVDPLVVPVAVDRAATAGTHAVPGTLSYYYCVAASGYCTRSKVDVSIPLTVR